MSEIIAESIVSQATREPFVKLSWDTTTQQAQLTPEQARQLSSAILESAEAAEQDAFLIWFLTKKIGSDDALATATLREYRKWREERNEQLPQEPV